jgi:signal transduction histidine kinase
MLRRRSLATRLVLSHVLATVTAIAVLGAIGIALLARNLQTATVSALDARASVVAVYAADLATSSATLRGVVPAVLGRFGAEPGTTIRIFAPDGTLLNDDGGIGLYPSREARRYVTTQFLALSVAPTDRRYVARPITRGGTIIGIVEASRSLAAERRPLRDLVWVLVPGSALALVVATLLALGLARGLLRPLRALREVAHRIAAGDLGARSYDRTADEIGQLAAAIDHMADDLAARFDEVEQLAQGRREFYRSVSHELRTPLTAIRGLAENLEDTATPDQARSLAIMQAETARLQRLVEELLAGGDGSFAPVRRRRPVDFAALVGSVVDLMRPRAERGGVELRVAALPAATVLGDNDRLRQALVNVFDNALKWTPPGGHVTVRLERHASTVALTVADTGPGISADLLPHIWERGTHGADGGQGLGLSLVREVATAHGGTADLEGSAGTTVRLTLPTISSNFRVILDSGG